MTSCYCLQTLSIYLRISSSFLEVFADFIIDEVEEKKHLDIKRLMIMKQKGIKIDTESERNIRKKWEGIDFKVFDIEERKYVYKVSSEEVPK